MAAGYAPQSERHHFVFLNPCGCPIGLVEAGRDVKDEDSAWHAMYDTRAAVRAERSRGVRVVHVDHATYEREFFAQMTGRWWPQNVRDRTVGGYLRRRGLFGDTVHPAGGYYLTARGRDWLDTHPTEVVR